MYSLNAPVPSPVARQALDLAADLPAATARERGEHTLLVKRLGAGTDDRPDHLVPRVREAIAGTAPFAVRVTGIDLFEAPVNGTAPVVYLTVESPPIERLHYRLCDTFDPVSHLEAEAYTPHVTVARGGDPDAARRVAARNIDERQYAVEELTLWDAYRRVDTARFSLPA